MIPERQLPRLLTGVGGHTHTLHDHEDVFGPPTYLGTLLDQLDASGLLGRGGAGFPTARKARLLREQRGHKFVVVNAMEGEPAAHKDQTLLTTNPHLVLDGAEYLAHVIGASAIAVCVARDNPSSVNAMKQAIHERTRRSLRGPSIELHTPPWRYVAGEESALVHWLDNHESLPQYRPHKPTVLKIGHAPVLVDNAETCAHVALIARYGADWFRTLGTSAHPGSTLVSVTGALARPTVLEVAVGTPLRAILQSAGADTNPQAVLLGGYGGTWIAGSRVDVPYANDALAPLGASVGAGIIIVVPRGACGLVEVQRITKWMANESARQCGPCAFGLPAISEDLAQLTYGSRDPAGALARLRDRCQVIEGRGACRHPDGVVRMVRSALEVFADDLHRHMNGSPCAGLRAQRYYVTVPTLEREEELVWE